MGDWGFTERVCRDTYLGWKAVERRGEEKRKTQLTRDASLRERERERENRLGKPRETELYINEIVNNPKGPVK